MSKPCSQKSKYAKMTDMYECNPVTGRWRLKKGYKKVMTGQASEKVGKRPLTAYFLYVQSVRKDLGGADPGTGTTKTGLTHAEWESLRGMGPKDLAKETGK